MTDRLGFSSTWKEGDEALALTLWGITEVSALIGGPFTTAEVHARLRREIDTMNVHKVQYWPVFSLQNNELAGCAGLRPYGSGEDVFELGVHLRPSYWGQGIALGGPALLSHMPSSIWQPKVCSQGITRQTWNRQDFFGSLDFLSRTKNFIRLRVEITLPICWSIPAIRVRCSLTHSNHKPGSLTCGASKTWRAQPNLPKM
jgi:hypothetical protein